MKTCCCRSEWRTWSCTSLTWQWTWPTTALSSTTHSIMTSKLPQQFSINNAMCRKEQSKKIFFSHNFYPDLCTVKNQYRKFETNISRKGIARPQSQFPHSCVFERFIYSHDGSTYSAAGNMWTDPGNKIAHIQMNVEIGTEAAQFQEKQYIIGIFVAVWVGNWMLFMVVVHWLHSFFRFGLVIGLNFPYHFLCRFLVTIVNGW